MNQAELTIEKPRFDEQIAFKSVEEAEASLRVKKAEHERARFLLDVSQQSYKARVEAEKSNPAR